MSNEDFFWSLVRRSDHCWEWGAGRVKAGYGMFVHWSDDGTKERILAHRYSLMLQGVNIMGRHVRHDCDNPPCVRPDHLRIGSPHDNTQDKVTRGRAAKKLDPDKVRDIRKRFATGTVTKASLAREFGVAKREIFSVVKREHWKHVE